MAKKAASLSSALSADHRIVVLVGKEPFLQGEYTAQVRELLTKAHGSVEVFRFDGASASAAEVLDECRTFGLMHQHKIVVVDNADLLLRGGDEEESAPPSPAGSGGGGRRKARKGPRELIEDYAAGLAESGGDGGSATLILRCERWNKGKLDALIEKVGTIKAIASPDHDAAVTWAINRCKKRHQAELDKDAAELLVDRIGPELGRLDTELAKVALLAAGANAKPDPAPRITRALVASIVGVTREEEVWVLQTALLNPTGAAALGCLREALDISGHHPTLVTWACVDLARKLHGASRGLRSGANPWALIRTLRLFGDSQDAILAKARATDPAPLAALLKTAVEADWKQKTGQADPNRALEALSLRFSEVLGPAASQVGGKGA